MASNGRRYGARVGALLLAAAFLLGAACPHCEAAHPGPTAVAETAPPCHPQPVEPSLAGPESGAAFDCGCPGCEVEAGIAFVATGSGHAQPVERLAPQLPAVSSALRPARADWTPPPYPGFSEHTVVRLN